MYPTKILLATDGSKDSATAVRTAVELASGTGSRLYVVHAISTAPRPPYSHFYAREMSESILESVRLAALRLLDDKVKEVEEMGGTVVASYYREGNPVEEVLRLAEELEVGLIVTGGRMQGLRRWLWPRSFTMNLFRRASCPVLLVREGSETEWSARGWYRSVFVGLPLWWPAMAPELVQELLKIT